MMKVFISNILIGQSYNLYNTPKEPFADPVAALDRWVCYLKAIYNRSLFSDEYLFLKTSSKGVISQGVMMEISGFQTLLYIIVDECKLLKGRIGSYSSRCMRRGGAQVSVILIY